MRVEWREEGREGRRGEVREGRKEGLRENAYHISKGGHRRGLVVLPQRRRGGENRVHFDTTSMKGTVGSI